MRSFLVKLFLSFKLFLLFKNRQQYINKCHWSHSRRSAWLQEGYFFTRATEDLRTATIAKRFQTISSVWFITAPKLKFLYCGF